LLRALLIPSVVESIDGSAFANSDISKIAIAADNRHFRVCGDFLLNFEGTTLIRYFGRDSFVQVAKEIEILVVGSFGSCRWIERIEFGTLSQLRYIGAGAFAKCQMLSSISPPPSTESLCHSCFRKCTGLLKVQFEAGSKLERIETRSFEYCSPALSIWLPMALRESEGLDLSWASDVEIVWYDGRRKVITPQ
jgi:hypothetical protein